LAERFGRIDVDQMLAETDSRKLSEWMAYDIATQPESWKQTAQICAVLSSGLHSKPIPYAKFLPSRRKFRMDDSAMKSTLKGMCLKMGGLAPATN
jgi:hypothetical protein